MNQRYSFIDFLSKPIYLDNEHLKPVVLDKVEIPIIQRDYAQGRAKSTHSEKEQKQLNETGKRFINSIFEHLNDGTDMEMDFIYGSVYTYRQKKNREEDIKYGFQPLDGQQRLTTLFLLHWYVAMRETDDEVRNNLMFQLRKFTYATRTSSRQFCEELCASRPEQFAFKEKISEEIANCAWFYKSFHKDPTICAMLNMLDAIQERYNTKTASSLYSLLSNLKFYPFPLNEFNLTEDLYIKMNARGKQLTDFENFKADFINWMKSDKNPEIEKFSGIPEGRNLPYYLEISLKIDNAWTNLFWNVTKNYDPTLREPKTKRFIYPSGKLVDPLFMRFFKRFLYLDYIVNAGEKVTVENLENNDIVKYFYGEKGNDDAIIYDSNDFESYYVPALSYRCVHDIETVLDKLCETYVCQQTSDDGTSITITKSVFDIVGDSMNSPWSEESTKEKQFYSPRIEQTGRMAFCACIEYLKINAFDESLFREWMRVIWNFIDEPTIRTVKGMIGALNFIRDIAPNSGNIYGYLKDVKEDDRPKRFADQFSEEIIKATLILKDRGNWEDTIKDAEKIAIFKGRIVPLLKEGLNIDVTTFNNRKKAVTQILKGNDLKNSSPNFLWIRAMLSFCKTIDATGQISLENGKQDNWRFLVSKQFMEPFRQLVDGAINEADVPSWMESLCSNYSPCPGFEWAYPLIKWKDGNGDTLLGHYSEGNRLLQDGEDYYLLKSVQYSEGVILLTRRRNELVKQLLSDSRLIHEWDTKSYSGDICNEFFRGTDIEISREVDIDSEKFVFKYIIKPLTMTVGLRADERKRKLFKDYLASKDIDSESKELRWIASVDYDYSSYQDFGLLISKIEDEVFSENNLSSICNILTQHISRQTSVETLNL